MDVRILTVEDVVPYAEHWVELASESGRDGDVLFGPYGAEVVFDVEEVRVRTLERWSQPLDAVGWRRAWGAFDDGDLVGSASVVGGTIESGLHRVELGIGVQRAYRRRGAGRALLDAVLTWCRAEPSIEWLDLGVFGDNRVAQALFRDAGFESIGTTTDRWRVDGVQVDEIAMTLHVATLLA